MTESAKIDEWICPIVGRKSFSSDISSSSSSSSEKSFFTA